MDVSGLEGPIPGDPFVIVGAVDLAAAGYVGEEWFLSSTASGYALAGEQSLDGRWSASRSGSAPFRTRIVVRRPEDPARFNGTVVVEWMNVTGGLDAAPDVEKTGRSRPVMQSLKLVHHVQLISQSLYTSHNDYCIAQFPPHEAIVMSDARNL